MTVIDYTQNNFELPAPSIPPEFQKYIHTESKIESVPDYKYQKIDFDFEPKVIKEPLK